MRIAISAVCACITGVLVLPRQVNAVVTPKADSVENTTIVSADGSGDYTSLCDAFIALSGSFTNVPDHTIYIASDLQETQPLVLKRNSGINSRLIIKPLGAPRTVSVISGPATSYNDLIGISWNSDYTAQSYVCNAVIDGSLEGSTTGLTLSFSHTDTNPSQQSSHHGLVWRVHFGGDQKLRN